MKCPLLSITKAEYANAPGIIFEACIKEECAWWSKKSSSCTLLDIEAAISRLHIAAQHIEDLLKERR